MEDKQPTCEVCENCGDKIGRLEVGHIYSDSVVCGQCITKLRDSEVGKSCREHPPIRTPSPVPRFTDKDANAKAGAAMFRVFFWIISGLIILGLLSMISNA